MHLLNGLLIEALCKGTQEVSLCPETLPRACRGGLWLGVINLRRVPGLDLLLQLNCHTYPLVLVIHDSSARHGHPWYGVHGSNLRGPATGE